MFRDSPGEWTNVQQQTEEEPEVQPVPNLQVKRNEAKHRINMANYYSAIVDGDLFGGDTSVAAKAVEIEMKEYANYRMEVLLGISKEKEAVVSPFSDDEVRALKALAQSAIRKFADPSSVASPQVKALSISNENHVTPSAPSVPAVRSLQVGSTDRPAQSQKQLPQPKPQPKKRKIGGRPADALPMPTGAGLTAAMTQLAHETTAAATQGDLSGIQSKLVTSAMINSKGE